MDCQAIGNYSYDCFADVSGGVGPYTYRWNDGHTGSADANRCSPNLIHGVVSVTVTDSVGSSASDTQNVLCYGGAP